MKELVGGYVIFLNPDEVEDLHRGRADGVVWSPSLKWQNIGKAFSKGLVIQLHKKDRYNLWTQLSEPHPPFNKLFEMGHWSNNLNTLRGWQKEIAKVMLRDDRFSHIPNLQS